MNNNQNNRGDSHHHHLDKEKCRFEPLCVNIMHETAENCKFRKALWTGCKMQVTLMCIPSDCEIGLESHHDTDQLIVIESGRGVLTMGSCKERAELKKCVGAGDAVFVPAGTWHNIKNSGGCPLRVFSVYAPPAHKKGTVHKTKADADKEEY